MKSWKVWIDTIELYNRFFLKEKVVEEGRTEKIVRISTLVNNRKEMNYLTKNMKEMKNWVPEKHCSRY